MLQSGQAPQDPPNLPTPESSTSQYASPGTQGAHEQNAPTTEESLALTSGQNAWVSSSEELSDVISKGYLPLHEAEDFVQDFKAIYQQNFPFVVLPSDLPLDHFRRERPYLLLSVLAVASRKQPVLQQILQQEFRTILSSKVIIEGGQDVDLLQGLLVFLAWSVLWHRDKVLR